MADSTAPPAVSVVMAVRNGERFLADAIESVQAQTFEAFELIVVDDGSTDSTHQIVAGYADGDPRVLVVRRPAEGRATALNHGCAIARAPLVARLDADDLAVPDRLERQLLFLHESPAVAVVGGAVTFVDAGSRAFAEVQYPLTDAEIRQAFDRTSPLAHPGVMLRKEAFDRVGGYRPVFTVAEDLDLWLRLAEGHSFANLPVPVVRYRLHADQDSARKASQMALEAVAARVAARARTAGRPDPLQSVDRIDEPLLRAIGATGQEIDATIVRDLSWLARTLARAGYVDAAAAMFAAAGARARSASPSGALQAVVLRAQAQCHLEQGRPLRARLESIRAALTERVRR